jgi:hypothetical protein
MTRTAFLRKLMPALVALIVVWVSGWLGCISPTLPLPPPNEPEVSPIDANGVVTLQGTAHSAEGGALVFSLNQRTGEGAITTASNSGSWEMKIGLESPCVTGDQIVVWQQSSGKDSENVIVKVPEAW